MAILAGTSVVDSSAAEAGFGSSYDYGDYGDGRTLTLVKMVAAANFISDPDVIRVGQRIYFPSFDLGG